ncbi:hypothetical protein MXMO3_01670 [Maritalea myrionectae]|uniref:AP2/ERF domain-containing protein n=1 Tax=Maritalea myrionectae TaxID=454601 RepID=A0A2R4ME78_9HYPH|nr:HNH endonuclease [Maritalea myrionectae]AVX04196.1 hypothetical protein MXMO3_01670 [Maritalea myrionectae]
MSELTQKELFSIIKYDPETGILTWAQDRGSNARKGQKIGSQTEYGYVVFVINGRRYRAHRIAFLYMTGRWPAECVDHINGIRHDNRWENLREASKAENCRNASKRRDNSSGYKGVSHHKATGKFQAQIRVNKKNTNLGIFPTAKEAFSAYCVASRKMHGAFSNTGESS